MRLLLGAVAVDRGESASNIGIVVAATRASVP